MKPIVCSIIFGHRPWLYPRLGCDLMRCRCGKVTMTRSEASKWWPKTPRWQRRRWRKQRYVALWGSLRRRQFGSDFDRAETAFFVQQAEWDREDARRRRAEYLFRAELRLTADKPTSSAVISGLTS